MTATICPCCGYDLERDEPLERAGIAMAPYGPVRFNGVEIRLTKAENAVLWTLLKAERPMPRHVIAERIGYEGEDRGDNCVDVLLTRIRRKLSEHGAHPIRTVHGVGVYIEEKQGAEA